MFATSTRSAIRCGLAALSLAVTIAIPARSTVAAQDAGAFVATLGTQGIEALAPNVLASDRFARLRSLVQQDFDVAGIGVFALGRYRLSATPQEQQEFFRLYPDFTVRALSSRLNEYGGASFRVIGQRTAGSETIISSEIVRANSGRVPVEWSLIDSGGQYRITDVVVAGLSMKIALRDQFASWIENNGGRFGTLLAVLRQQLAQAR